MHEHEEELILKREGSKPYTCALKHLYIALLADNFMVKAMFAKEIMQHGEFHVHAK
jgi:hypothetical protein